MSYRRIIPVTVITIAAVAACTGSASVGVSEVVEDRGVFADYYDPCVFDEDCPIDTDCEDVVIDYGDVVVSDAMCTVACGSDFDCPFDGLCLGASSGPPLCYEPCFDDFDCPSGFGCVQDVNLFTFDPVCMPI